MSDSVIWPGGKPRVGDLVRVVATDAMGIVVEVDSRHRLAEVDLGEGVYAEFSYEEIAPVAKAQA